MDLLIPELDSLPICFVFFVFILKLSKFRYRRSNFSSLALAALEHEGVNYRYYAKNRQESPKCGFPIKVYARFTMIHLNVCPDYRLHFKLYILVLTLVGAAALVVTARRTNLKLYMHAWSLLGHSSSRWNHQILPEWFWMSPDIPHRKKTAEQPNTSFDPQFFENNIYIYICHIVSHLFVKNYRHSWSLNHAYMDLFLLGPFPSPVSRRDRNPGFVAPTRYRDLVTWERNHYYLH